MIHRLRDPAIPFATGQLLAASIPGAKFVTFDEATHAAQIGDSSEVIAAIDSFVPAKQEEQKIADSGAGAVCTVLFTDLVGHTEMMSRLGDERGRAVLREHERITREVLKAHGGTEVKTMGDGSWRRLGR